MDGLIQKEKREVLADYLNKIFVFTIMWSIGALLELDDRRKLQEFITGNFYSYLCLFNSLYRVLKKCRLFVVLFS